MKKIFAITVFLSLLSLPVLAQRPSLDIYTRAIKLSSQGSQKEAVTIFRNLVNDYPDDPMVDDALFQIGSTSERYLGDFDAAKEAYTRLIEQFPNEKTALRAQARLTRLEEGRKSGDEPLRIFNEILNKYSIIGSEEALLRTKELYRLYPNFSERDHVIFWIAEEEFRQRNYKNAVDYYQTLLREYPDSKWSYFATGKIGKTHIEMREFDAALAAFENLASFEGRHPGARQASEGNIKLVRRFHRLRLFYFAALAITGAALLVWLAGTRWRNVERGSIKGALSGAGILSLIFLAGFIFSTNRPWMFQAALLYSWIAVAAAAVMNHLFIRSREFSWAGRAFVTLGAFLAVTSIIYVVYYQVDVVNMLYDSIQYAMERGG